MRQTRADSSWRRRGSSKQRRSGVRHVSRAANPREQRALLIAVGFVALGALMILGSGKLPWDEKDVADGRSIPLKTDSWLAGQHDAAETLAVADGELPLRDGMLPAERARVGAIPSYKESITSTRGDSPTRDAVQSPETNAQGPRALRRTPSSTSRKTLESAGKSSVSRAQKALQRGRLSRAEALYNEVAASGKTGPAHYGLGYVAVNRGETRKAIALFRSSYRAGYNQALIGLGEAYRQSGAYGKASRAYAAYLKKAPKGSSASLARHQLQRLEELSKIREKSQTGPR